MEVLTSEIALAAVGLAGLGITSIAIIRDVYASRGRMMAVIVPTQPPAVLLAEHQAA
jgi:hypothetical protein